MLREALTTNRISFSDEFYSGTDVAETKQQLQGELSNFQVLTDPPKTPFGKVRAPPGRLVVNLPPDAWRLPSASR